MFDAKKEKENVVNWIREFFEKNGKYCKAIIGISGGKDSTVVAALCVEALGREKVLGVMLPNGNQKDIDDCYAVFDHLKFEFIEYDIGHIYDYITDTTYDEFWKKYRFNNESHWASRPYFIKQSRINLLPRLRMSILYYISQSENGRVANTSNLSETYIGWSTRYGDSVGDFSPLSRFTTDEVIAIGRECGIPEELLVKPPADGLTNRTDEENFGFSYEVLNKYIRTGICEDEEIKKLIDEMHEKNLFKLQMMPCYEYKS